eukprot:8773965-Pyramimonas_sp.AAC.1
MVAFASGGKPPAPWGRDLHRPRGASSPGPSWPSSGARPSRRAAADTRSSSARRARCRRGPR